MAEQSRAEKYRQSNPEPLTREGNRKKADGMLHDLKTLLTAMPQEDKAVLAAELKKLSEGNLSSEVKLSK